MATRGRRRDPGKERFWRKVVNDFVPGRSTVRQWCLKHGVSEPSFYAWRCALKRRDAASRNASTHLLRVKVAAPPQQAAPGVTIELPTGLRLHVSVDQLPEVLDVLEARRC